MLMNNFAGRLLIPKKFKTNKSLRRRRFSVFPAKENRKVTFIRDYEIVNRSGPPVVGLRDEELGDQSMAHVITL
jgi:hypothetical protein